MTRAVQAVQCVRQRSLECWLSVAWAGVCGCGCWQRIELRFRSRIPEASRPWMQREGGGATARTSLIDHARSGGARREQWGDVWVCD